MTEQEWLASGEPIAMMAWLTDREGYADPASRAGGTGRASDRKLRLFACAAWRAGRRPNQELLDAIVAAESLADGVGKGRDSTCTVLCVSAANAANAAAQHAAESTSEGQATRQQLADIMRDIVGNNPFKPAAFVWMNERLYPRPERERSIGDDISDLTPVRWLTPDVVALAHAAYDLRLDDGTLDPVRLSILADALEEAGCCGEKCKLCGGEGRPMELIRSPIPGSQRLGMPQQSGQRIDCPWCAGSGRKPHPILAHLRSPGPHYRGCWAVDILRSAQQ